MSKWEPLIKKTIRPKALCQDNEVMLSIHGRNKKGALALTIGADVASDLRWMPGDKVNLVQSEGLLAVMRNPSEGWTLTSAQKKDPPKGKSRRLIAKMTVPQELIGKLLPDGKPKVIHKPLIEDGTVLVLMELPK